MPQAPKKAFALRLDPALYAAVERLAAHELRSVNAELEVLLREALGGGALKIGMHGAILGANDGPARLGPPRDTIVLLIEEVRHGHALRRPDDLLFFPR